MEQRPKNTSEPIVIRLKPGDQYPLEEFRAAIETKRDGLTRAFKDFLKRDWVIDPERAAELTSVESLTKRIELAERSIVDYSDSIKGEVKKISELRALLKEFHSPGEKN